MFSSINFLFLISLAFISWIILCYFKQIEEQRAEEINNTNYMMERNFDETSMKSCRDNYDIYLNFLCIFTCIYALARITHITENYIAKQMHRKFGGSNMQNNKIDPSHIDMKIDQKPNAFECVSTNIDAMIAQQREFLSQIEQLKEQNERLEKKLQEAKESTNNNILMLHRNHFSNIAGGDMEHREDHAIIPSNIKSNVFISNSHFHLNRQVFVNEGNIKLNIRDLQDSAEGGFTQIWQKYLNMQKFAIRSQESNGNATNDDQENKKTPVIVSTEELQSLQGLY